MNDFSVSNRFQNEKTGVHWQVDPSESSFTRLLEHIQVRTQFYDGFCKSFNYFLENRSENNMIIADIGGGVGWTSAIMAKHPRVKKVYLVEPSINRRNSFQHICNHMKVDPLKVDAINGSFHDFSIPGKVDAIVMCASLHHCRKDYLADLFRNIFEFLIEKKGKARVLIANEHYVNIFFSIRRQLSLLKWLFEGKKPFWTTTNPRHYHPDDFEHWRTKSELDSIFKKNNFIANYCLLRADLCDDKPLYESLMMWRYYYATLDYLNL